MKIVLKELMLDLKDKCILEDVNCEFNSNQIYAVIGNNGEGKSMLLKLVASAISVTGGSICLKDRKKYYYSNIKDLKYIRENISAMLVGYECLMPNLTCNQNILYKSGLQKVKVDMEKMYYYLKLFNIEEFQDDVVHKLSTGTKQKIVIIIALLNEKNILIFDEPTIGLDQISIDIFIRELKTLVTDKIIIISTHEKTLINSTDKFVEVSHRKTICN